MALVATTEIIAEVNSNLRIIVATNSSNPITNATGQITGFETAIDITNATDFTITLPSGETETEYDTLETTKKTTLRRAKSQKTVDVVSGELVTAGDSKPSITFKAPLTATQFAALKDIHQNAERFFLVGLIENSAGSGAYWVHAFGKLTGDFSYQTATLGEFEFTIQGGEAHTSGTGGEFGDYNTAMNADIAAEGYDDTTDAITPTDLATGDYTTLIGGTPVFKAHA